MIVYHGSYTEIVEIDLSKTTPNKDFGASRISRYLRGKISKEAFFEDLAKYPESHQICFGTSKSLVELERIDLLVLCDIEDIGQFIILGLMNDYNMTELKAEDLYFASDTYVKLCDESTKMHEKKPHELYELLKLEKRTVIGASAPEL